jgi:hypothetical protein
MPTKRVSELPTATSISGTESVLVVQAGVTKIATVTLVRGSGGGGGGASPSIRQEFIAVQGQTVFILSDPYVINADELRVEINGIQLKKGADYVETSTTSFTLTYPAALNDVVVAWTLQ